MNEAPTEDQHTRLRLAATATLATLAMVALALFMRRADGPTPASDPSDTARPMAEGPAGLEGELHDDASAPVDSVPTKGASADPSADPRASAPLPPPGTRLYASVAELVADPPAAGETVWMDAYHGEVIEEVAWDDAAESGCPSRFDSVLLDQPFLHQLDMFDGLTTSIPDAHAGISRLAAGLGPEGELTPWPSLPRYGRLVVHVGAPSLARCDEADRIVVVERVAHVFEAKEDWTAIREAIRASETIGWIDGSTSAADAAGGPDEAFGTYTIAVPAELAPADVADSRSQPPEAGVVTRLAQQDLPDHPIVVRRYPPGSPGYEDPLRAISEPDRWFGSHVQRPSGPVHNAVRPDHPLTFAVLSSEDDPAPPEGFDYMTPHVVRALVDVAGVVYEFELTLPKDNVLAQPLLWRLEALLDRFVSLEATAPTRSAARSSLTGLDQTVINDVGFAAMTVDGVDGLAIVGGTEGIALIAIDPYGWSPSMRGYSPPSPASIGLTQEGDIDRVALRIAVNDRKSVATMLADDGGSWTAHAVAIRPPYAYAAIEWPSRSGLTWLYVLDASKRQVERMYIDPADALATVGAARLDPGEESEFDFVRAHDMAIAGDRLLVATGAGLFDVDVSNPEAPVVRPPIAGSTGAASAIAVAPDGHRAWACGGTMGDGFVVALDVSDPSSLGVAGTYRGDDAFLDCATDGTTLWATTGSEDQEAIGFDVSGRDSPLVVNEIESTGGVANTVHLLGNRLFLGYGERGAWLELAAPYPPPIDFVNARHLGLSVHDVTGANAPTGLGVIPLPSVVEDLAAAGPFLLAAAGERGVYIYAFED